MVTVENNIIIWEYVKINVIFIMMDQTSFAVQCVNRCYDLVFGAKK